ncbi:MAG: hypothetical protein IIW66_02025 [Bacteroidales bacterium]|nr:hypothetical protein [Bacteroidales bacterium]
MKYIGKCRDKQDVLHTITITTKVGTGSTNLTLCTSPFVEEMEGDDNTIYKPCKYSSATIRVLTQNASDYMFDIYQSRAQDVSVELKDENNKIEWLGYVTPNLYDMGYESAREELEIECIDALSTLQYFRYTPIDSKPKTNSFYDIIKHILHTKTPYVAFYFPSVYENIKLDQLKISEQNFFDEDGEGWTMKEVLEEICKYLNVTCVADGNEVWFVHYSSLGKVPYRRYRTMYKTYADQEVDSRYSIDEYSYSESGGTISLQPTYNRASVTSKINEYKNLLPDVFEEKYLSNANGNWNKVLGYVLNGASYTSTSGVAGRYKFLTNKYYKTYYYDKSSGAQVDKETCKTYPELQNYVGATLVQASFENYNPYNLDTAFVSNGDKTLTDYILIHQHDKGAGKKVFSTISSEIPETYIGKNTKIVIKGSIRCMDREKWCYIPTDYGNKKDDFDRMNLYLECQLKWGDYYYHNYKLIEYSNGYSFTFYRAGYWDKNEGTFRLYFNAPDTSHINNKEYSILDTSGDAGNEGTSSGFVISLPENATIQGSIPEFTIYSRGRVDSSYRLDCIWLKDFSIQLAIAKDTNVKDVDWETDTEYSNIINDEYIEEADGVECKINTWDNKAPTYSVVMLTNGSTTSYLDEVKSLASGETHRFEEHIIYDYVTQYSQPAIQLDLNIKERVKPYTVVSVPFLGSDKKFIVDSYTRDYWACNNSIKLVEKWNL